jgi:hypothetical protein
VRVVHGEGTRRASVHFVALDPDEGYVRGPLLVQADIVTAAAYDRAGDSYTVPPSRIIRFTLDGHVVDRIDLQGAIVSLASGEGARWALTHDKEVNGPQDPEFRVKRVAADGRVSSNPVPPGEQPNGDIVAAGGSVWVPVTDGVLRFDVTTGAFAGKIPLDVSAERAVALLGKFAYVTDGRVLRRLDAGSDTAEVAPGSTAPDGLEYVDIAPGVGTSSWAMGRGTPGTFVWQVGVCCGVDGVTATSPSPGSRSFVTVGDVNWIEGELDGHPTLLRFPEPPVDLETARTANVADARFTPVDDHTALLVSKGHVYRVDLRA